MTSLKDGLREYNQSHLTPDTWAEIYIKELEQHIKSKFPYNEGMKSRIQRKGWIAELDEVLRFLRGEKKK